MNLNLLLNNWSTKKLKTFLVIGHYKGKLYLENTRGKNFLKNEIWRVALWDIFFLFKRFLLQFYIQVMEDKTEAINQAKFNDKAENAEREKIIANKH